MDAETQKILEEVHEVLKKDEPTKRDLLTAEVKLGTLIRFYDMTPEGETVQERKDSWYSRFFN